MSPDPATMLDDHGDQPADPSNSASPVAAEPTPRLRHVHERLLDAPDAAVEARARLRWWREVLYTVGIYIVYSAVRNTFGSSGDSSNGRVSPVAVQHAYGHALDIIRIERALGLFFEPRLQRWYLGLPSHGFIRSWNDYYGTFHFVLPVIGLVMLFRRYPDHYARWRNTLVFTTLLALVGFAGYSLMPPRLLESVAPYGACNPAYGLHCHHYGIVDTLAKYNGFWTFGSGPMANVSNQYAAMPSLHIGWSTWCTLVFLPHLRRWWLKALMVLYPVATLFCIIITGNHYWLDAVGGLLTLGVGYLLAVGLGKVWPRRPTPAPPAGS